MDQQEQRPKRVFRKKKQLEIEKADLSQELYKHNLELVETNRILTLLRNIDNLVLEAEYSLDELAQKITDAFNQMPTYGFVALLVNPNNSNSLKLMGWATATAFKPRIDKTLVAVDLQSKWLTTPNKSIKVSVENLTDAQIAQVLSVTEKDAQQIRDEIPVNEVVLTRLTARGRIVGIMLFGFTQSGSDADDKQVALIERLGGAVGIALDNKLLFDENQRVVKELQATNEKLKALDATKDEFISMASHQLRTPLTSVKGYLSMVIEGDAGKITANQHKLLDQAFVSSQRMVYLIADLLNVSRLRTGKFIIENAPTNLAEAVQGELEQLKETAAGRKLELTYDKPKDFPMYMLDETKIRQVIMNFIDNAIYYTPAGGHIKVALKNLPTSIEFTVTDDGLGVPKAEQHHLFEKFYRAGNAKQARPDGTGLGLFMAKKVIIAQGGNLVFTSTEGKGSTFGFSFDKSKLQVPSDKEQVPSDKEQVPSDKEQGEDK